MLQEQPTMTQAANAVDLDAFRAEVRGFLQNAVPDDIALAVRSHCLVTREQAMRWQRILHARGWAAPGWPVQHGGTGWSLAQQAIFREEITQINAPVYENIGIDTIGPTLIRHGSAAQQQRFLGRMLSFEDFWAQGYSEPEAGSDLASLRTTARREGDHYVVSGSKIWQSYGHWANWALVLVRTNPDSPRKQDGISVLLIDLNSKGVEVRPIRFMHGGVLHVQMFFDEVRVPVENLVGTESAGWAVAKGLLVTERLFVARVAECRAALMETPHLAQGRGVSGASLLDQDVYARRYAELDIRVRAMEAAWWPTVRAVEAGQEPTLEASLLKLQGNEVLQDLHQLQQDFLGTDGLVFDANALTGTPSTTPLVPEHAGNLTLHMWRYRGITLGGGTSEVQRGIVAKAIFGGQTALEQPLAADMSEEQVMLDEGVRRLLADSYSFDQRSAMLAGSTRVDTAFWSGYGDLGVRGLLLPESDDGFGGTLADLLPVMGALGEALVLEPVLWASVLPQQVLMHSTNFEGRRAALDGLQQGDFVAVAHTERNDPIAAQPVTAKPDGDGWLLTGRNVLVLGADVAHRVIVRARLDNGLDTGTFALFDCAVNTPGLTVENRRLHDGRGAADVIWQGVRVSASKRLAEGEQAARILDDALAFATVALCAESVGSMRRALALTVEYMRTRKQFGKSLAEYQALQHRVVEHYRSWVHAQSLLREAAAAWGNTSTPAVSSTERACRVSAAKWMAGKAGRAIALDCLQLHGAVGLQDETAISHHARRLAANDVLLGDHHHHLGRMVALRGRV
ncbi:acyl-CoA dehydrogenase family protein [Ideonella sp.]|jgi:acyl-CoA dehydrogenase|uniref:acyl-CoA dehydrogenase family protein n=1 Tax=Ideonella sp. TaxID=1929293 RepID=UPI0037BF00D7